MFGSACTIQVRGMDALRQNVTQAEVCSKAAMFRQTKALESVDSARLSLASALTDLKNNNTPETKKQADQAAAAMKTVNTALAVAKQELTARKTEAEAAKKAYNGYKSARPRRLNARGKYEETSGQEAYKASGLDAKPQSKQSAH